MSVVTYEESTENTEKNLNSYVGQPRCAKCQSYQIIEYNGERVCRSCGRIHSICFDFDTFGVSQKLTGSGYHRGFYFNERVSRWACGEPPIDDDIWQIILEETTRNGHIYGTINADTCNRTLIGKILRNVVITKEMALKHQSKKFKCQLLTKKRFYDKYYEKWKTIRWRLTGAKPLLPSHQLVNTVKQLFVAAQEPFERHRHHWKCDGRPKCGRYFKCWHNFINYDYTIRIFLQICDQRYGFTNAYELFKDEFTLASKKIITNKLRPMMQKICNDNGWKMPEKD